MSVSAERSFIILLGLLIGLSPLAVDMYLPAMPAIGEGLAASPDAVQQTLSVYLACFALPQLAFGPLSDARGRRFTMLIGLLVFALGSMLCGLARDIGELVLARGLQGLGASAIIVTVPALVRDRFEGEEFARVMGFIMMVMAIAPLVAPLAGGFVLTLSSWRTIFWVLAALALLGLVFFHIHIGETLASEKRSRPSAGRLVNNYISLLTQRNSLCFMLCAGFAFAGMMAFLSASPFVYIELYGISEQHYGLVFALNILTMIAFGAAANRFVKRTGSYRMLGIAMVVVLAGSACLLAMTAYELPPLVPMVGSIMLFVGTNGVVSANSMALVMNRFGHISGSASAMAGTLRFGAGSLASVAVSALHDGTAFPLLSVMIGCGVLAVVFYGLASIGIHGETTAEPS